MVFMAGSFADFVRIYLIEPHMRNSRLCAQSR